MGFNLKSKCFRKFYFCQLCLNKAGGKPYSFFKNPFKYHVPRGLCALPTPPPQTASQDGCLLGFPHKFKPYGPLWGKRALPFNKCQGDKLSKSSEAFRWFLRSFLPIVSNPRAGLHTFLCSQKCLFWNLGWVRTAVTIQNSDLLAPSKEKIAT